MINFRKSALRPTGNGARLAAARRLVGETLARHGLHSPPHSPIGESVPEPTPGSASGQDEFSVPPGRPLSGFTNPLGQMDMSFRGTTARQVTTPEGAEFRHGRHECAAGARDYRCYIPSRAHEGMTGLVLMLHGCTQNPEDFAIGTGMNALAEKHRFVVVYPQQSRGDNAQSCWNWFSRSDQRRDRGEPAILAGLTRKLAQEHGLAKEQCFVAGLSAGAAMAVILGETYPDVFACVGAHSGLPFGAAKDVPSAFAAMAGNGAGAALHVPASPASDVRTIVFHGTADTTVHPSNGDAIVRQVLDGKMQQSIASEEKGQVSGRGYTRTITASVDGVSELEHWVIDGLGHAWSGGQPGGSYSDTLGPDASAEMIRFFYGLSSTLETPST